MEKYKEIILEEKRLYGGSHLLKMWINGTNSGFIVKDCIHKTTKEYDNFKEAKEYFLTL